MERKLCRDGKSKSRINIVLKEGAGDLVVMAGAMGRVDLGSIQRYDVDYELILTVLTCFGMTETCIFLQFHQNNFHNEDL